MQTDGKGRGTAHVRAPSAGWTGAAFAGCVALSLALGGGVAGGGAPGIESADAAARFYANNAAKVTAASTVFAIASIALMFFVGCLWRALRAEEGPARWLAAVALTGGGVAAAGMLMLAGFGILAADVAHRLDPNALLAIHVLNHGFYVPLGGGMAVMLLAGGLILVQAKNLPRWLGWVAIVFGLGNLSPARFAAFLAAALWIVLAGVLLGRRPTRDFG